MGRRLAWVGLALLAAYLVFIGGGWSGIYEAELRIATVTLAGVVLAAWGVVAWRRPEWRPRSVLLPAIVACLASLTISTLFSRVPRVSVEYLGYAILLAALYLLLVRLMASPFFRPRLVGLGTVLFTLIAIEFVAFVVYLWIGWWGSVGHLAIPPLRPNFIGLSWGNPSAILTMVALFAVPTAATVASWRPRGVVGFLLVGFVIAIAAILSGSRTGWLAIAITALVGLVALLRSRERRARLRTMFIGRGPDALPRAIQIGLLAVLAGALIVGAVFAPAILSRVAAGGEDLRTGFYIAAIRMFEAAPIVGVGPGSWAILRPFYTAADLTDYYIPHAHDVPVQTLAETGMIGAIAGVVLTVALGRLVFRAARSDDGATRRMAWLTGLGLLYFGLHNLLDFYPNMPAALFAAALPVAYLDALAQPEAAILRVSIPTAWRGRGLAVGGALVAISILGLVATEVPAFRMQDANGLADHDDWAAAYAIAGPIADADGSIAPYVLTAGLAADHTGDHARAATYFTWAADASDLPEAWLNLAAERVILGDRAGASEALNSALRLGIQRPEVAMAAGDLALKLNDIETAARAFESAITTAPSLAGDPWWSADPQRKNAFDAAYAEALQHVGPDGVWVLQLMHGDRLDAATTAAAASDPALAGEIVRAWDGDAAALDSVLSKCRDHPLDFGLVIWCARLENLAGNEKAASAFRSQAETLSAGDSAQTLQLRVRTGDDSGPITAPEGAYNWGPYAYRRWTPQDLLVPSLIHLRFA